MNEFQQIPGISLSYKGKVRDIYETKNQKYLLILKVSIQTLKAQPAKMKNLVMY